MTSRLTPWRGLLVATLAVGGCASKENIGGRWLVETKTSPLPESGNVTQYLWREEADGRLRYVARLRDYRYYGDDCIAYASGLNDSRYFVACGERTPVLIAVEHETAWKLEESGMVRLGQGRQLPDPPPPRLSVEDLKRRASSPVPDRLPLTPAQPK